MGSLLNLVEDHRRPVQAQEGARVLRRQRARVERFELDVLVALAEQELEHGRLAGLPGAGEDHRRELGGGGLEDGLYGALDVGVGARDEPRSRRVSKTAFRMQFCSPDVNRSLPRGTR